MITVPRFNLSNESSFNKMICKDTVTVLKLKLLGLDTDRNFKTVNTETTETVNQSKEMSQRCSTDHAWCKSLHSTISEVSMH